MKILAATNSPKSMLSYKSKLVASGMDLITAATSNDVKGQYDSHAPDLMILDKGMNKQSRSEIIAHIRGSRKSAFPILMISSSNIQPCIDEIFVLGVDDYIQRPQGHVAVKNANEFVNMDFFTAKKSLQRRPD